MIHAHAVKLATNTAGLAISLGNYNASNRGGFGLTDSKEQASRANDPTLKVVDALEQGSIVETDGAAKFLLETIETEILPRLMLVHKDAQNDNQLRKLSAADITPAHVDELVELLFDRSVSSGQEYIDTLLNSGHTLERVYIALLAPAARLMGEMWESDERDFSDVTIGLCRLHEILRHHQLQMSEPAFTHSAKTPSILLATACGDQHVFGVIMVAEFFRKDGWIVTSEPGASPEELKRIAASQHFDIIGLSIARSLSVEAIKDEIKNLRAASQNQNLKIIIGGALLERDSIITRDVNADAFSTDASKAAAAARTLLEKPDLTSKGAAT